MASSGAMPVAERRPRSVAPVVALFFDLASADYAVVEYSVSPVPALAIVSGDVGSELASPLASPRSQSPLSPVGLALRWFQIFLLTRTAGCSAASRDVETIADKCNDNDNDDNDNDDKTVAGAVDGDDAEQSVASGANDRLVAQAAASGARQWRSDDAVSRAAQRRQRARRCAHC